MSAIDWFKRTKEKLDTVSPSFCMAKWQQVTMHLHNGTNHSCHHPGVHHVSLEELSENVNALHNSKYKKEQRKKMLAGERPSECQYCWTVEDIGEQGQYSDRVAKSSPSSWNKESDFDEISKLTGDEDVYPTYLEVSFSNRCNLKCTYCSPIYSSSWQEELDKNGDYDTLGGFNRTADVRNPSFRKHEDNPYLTAFKVWWESAKDHVRVLRVTGGEPLLEKTTFEILEDFASRDHYTDIQIAINSNLMVSPAILNRFIALLKRLEGKVKQINIFTSCEAHGEAAEYIRTGLVYDTWLSNLNYAMTEVQSAKFTVMTTVNALSVTTMHRFLEDILVLKLRHRNSMRNVAISMSFNMMHHPYHQRLDILPAELHSSLDSAYQYLQDKQEGRNGNDYYCGFFDYEIHAFSRLISFMKSGNAGGNLHRARIDFYKFFSQYDTRTGSDFGKVFPELRDFMESCQSLAQSQIDVRLV